VSKRIRVEVQPNGCGFLMRGDEVLADFEDPALARALLAVAREARLDCKTFGHGPGAECNLCKALSRLDKRIT
jgi:hypothetical protein